MAWREESELLRHYWQELSYLRNVGGSFAQKYPRVASHLEMGPDQSADPHVERLIEAFAFLTGRIQKRLDDDYPEIATELLNLLYPHFLTPIPSVSVARFDVDPKQGKISTGHLIPRHTQLFVHADDGSVCRFRTAYPVSLLPLAVVDASLEGPDRFEFLDREEGVAGVLRLELRSFGGPLAELELGTVRFYLDADRVVVYRLYELLFAHLGKIFVRAGGNSRPRELAVENLQPVGFGLDEEVLPFARYAHPAHRLLQEYFVFPEKYHFVDLAGLDGYGMGETLEVFFTFDQLPRIRLSVSPETFALGATPIVNLFPKLSEPLRVDHHKLEYRLVADYRRERTTEIHSIVEVRAATETGDETRVYEPFYSFTHSMARRGQQAFWHARRVQCQRQDLTGTDLLLSFVDLGFEPARPGEDVLFAHLLCTNRDLAEQMPARVELQTDVAAPIARIVALKKPTPQVSPPLGGQTLWRLISQLSLNHLSLGNGEDNLKALREILRLYCPEDQASAYQQVLGIESLAERKVVERMGWDAWRGFCRGTEIRVVFDERNFAGASPLLLGAVLNHFFALYAPTNSFTRLVVARLNREGVWKRWPAMAGVRPLL